MAESKPGHDVDGVASSGTERVVTIPNALSVLRLLGVPLFLWLILGPHADALALVVLAASGITDWLDGVLARRLNQVSELGKVLDPVADRLYILAALLGLALREIVPWWLAIGIPMRDLLMLLTVIPALRLAGYGPLPVHFVGKAGTFCLLYAFPLLLIGDGGGVIAQVAMVLGWAFAIWGIGLYWWSGVLYGYQTYRLIRSPG